MSQELMLYVKNYIDLLNERRNTYENALMNTLNPLDRLLFLEKVHEVDFSLGLFSQLERVMESKCEAGTHDTKKDD